MSKREFLASLSPSESTRLAILIGEVIKSLTEQSGYLPDAVANWIAAQSDDWFEAFINSAMALPSYGESHSPEFSDIRKALSKPHMLILGETGAGKSTLVKYLVSQSSASAIVLDPHAAPDDWQGMKVIGAGRKYKEIGEEVNRLVELMNTRYEARAQGQKTFVPLLIIIDEFPAIASALGKSFTEAILLLVREARKIGIKLIILSIGSEVKSLGIEGQGSIRECFAIVSLGKFATARAKSLGDEAIKAALRAAKYAAMLDDFPCALPEIDRVDLQRFPLPPDYQALLTSTSTNTNTYTLVSPLVGSQQALTDLRTCTYTYESTDFDLARKCKSMVEAGKPQTWIIENILNCRGRNFAQGKQRFTELLALCN